MPADDAMIPRKPRERADLAAVYEVAPAPVWRSLRKSRATSHAKGGAGLIVDYGYEQRLVSVERCKPVGGHKFAMCSPAPSDSDLSAHVDFCGLAARARGAARRLCGPTGQGDFLAADLGLDARARAPCARQSGGKPAILARPRAPN